MEKKVIPIRIFQCNVCDAAFMNKSTLTKHKRLHTGEKLYKCDQCDKAFSLNSDFTRHKRVHTDEKPFICDLCDKAFARKSDLIIHKKVHTVVKPYKCDQCDKAFSLNSALIIHKRVHTGEKPFICDLCDKAFAQKCDRKKHMRVHTGEKPFKCHQCEKAFSQSSSLITHMRQHIGEKHYNCHVCNNSFSSSDNLTRHKRIHFIKKPCTCEQCGLFFMEYDQLNSHRMFDLCKGKPFIFDQFEESPNSSQVVERGPLDITDEYVDCGEKLKLEIKEETDPNLEDPIGVESELQIESVYSTMKDDASNDIFISRISERQEDYSTLQIYNEFVDNSDTIIDMKNDAIVLNEASLDNKPKEKNVDSNVEKNPKKLHFVCSVCNQTLDKMKDLMLHFKTHK